MDEYININALDIDFKNAERGVIAFEDWANQNDLYFIIEELDGMDGNLHIGTHIAKMYYNENVINHAYGNGTLEALINLAKQSTGMSWQFGKHTIKSPMKFKGIK